MKLILDRNEIDCLAWRVVGQPNKKLDSLNWSFITRTGAVWLVTPLQIQVCGADGINPYAETVEIRSTLWPVAKLIRDVSGTKDKGARLAHVEKFVRAVCGRWLVGLNHDGNMSDWGWMGRHGADPDALCQLIDCGELLKPATLAKLTAWLAGLASKHDRMTHEDCLSVLEEIRDRLEPHILTESKKWRSDDPMDGFCPLVVPTKKWGSQNCSGYSTWDDFCGDEEGEYGFVNFYIAGWLNNPIDDRGLAVSGGYREFLERHIDFEAIFPTVNGAERILPVDRIAEKAFAMNAEDAELFDRIPKRKIAPTNGGGAKRGPKPPPAEEKQKEDRILTRWDAALAHDPKLTYENFGRTLVPIMNGSRLEALIGRVRKRRKKVAGKIRQ